MTARALRRELCLLSIAGAALLGFGCAQECALVQCDIRDEACQRAALSTTRCVRGGEAVDVPVRVIDADDFIDEQASLIEADERADITRREYRGLALLQLVPEMLSAAEGSRLRYANVAAFYSFEDKRITILDRGQRLDSLNSSLTLVHEYVHALQDAEHDLEGLFEAHASSLDGYLALSAILEGEASLFANHALALSLGYELDDVDFAKAFRGYQRWSEEALDESEAPWPNLYTYFTYAYGLPYADAAHRADPHAGIAALFADPPASTRQIITGYGAAPPGGKPWLEPELEELAIPQLEPRFTLVSAQRAGLYALWAFLPRWVGLNPVAFEPLRQLRGDVLSIFDSDDGGVIAAWRIRFSSEDAASEFESTLDVGFFEQDDPDAKRTTWREGRDVLVMTGRSEGMPLPQLDELTWAPAPESPMISSEPALVCPR